MCASSAPRRRAGAFCTIRLPNNDASRDNGAACNHVPTASTLVQLVCARSGSSGGGAPAAAISRGCRAAGAAPSLQPLQQQHSPAPSAPVAPTTLSHSRSAPYSQQPRSSSSRRPPSRARSNESERTSLQATIWPLAFFTRRRRRRKYLRLRAWQQAAALSGAQTTARHTRLLRRALAASRQLLSLLAPSSRRRRHTQAHSPELAARAHVVRRPHLHPIQRGAGIGVGGQVAAHHLVLLELEEALFR